MECCGGPLELESRVDASADFAVFAPGARAELPPEAAAYSPSRADAPYERASCCSHVTYGYVEPLLALRSQRPLAYADLPPIAMRDTAARTAGAPTRAGGPARGRGGGRRGPTCGARSSGERAEFGRARVGALDLGDARCSRSCSTVALVVRVARGRRAARRPSRSRSRR